MGNRSSVLIIDNNAEELMQLITFMEGKYKLTDISSGKECIDCALELSPDVILMDDMIIEPNCYDVCQALKADPVTGDIPIILMSDLSANELEDEVVYLGSDDYICKPIVKNELLEKIDTLLSFSQAH
ncbi:MAG: response regulator [Pseudomonadales bacterium]